MGIISRIKSIIRRALRHLTPQRGKSRRPHRGVKSKVKQITHQPYIRVNSINKIILSMINNERQKRNLHPLIYDHELELHATRWSKHMAHQNRLSHSGTILENVCMVPANGSPNTITKSMFYCWKKSKPHWNWMMNAEISKAGFGYTIRGKFAYGAFAFDNPH
jgi:uncharacterized protein YkwD